MSLRYYWWCLVWSNFEILSWIKYRKIIFVTSRDSSLRCRFCIHTAVTSIGCSAAKNQSRGGTARQSVLTPLGYSSVKLPWTAIVMASISIVLNIYSIFSPPSFILSIHFRHRTGLPQHKARTANIIRIVIVVFFFALDYSSLCSN